MNKKEIKLITISAYLESVKNWKFSYDYLLIWYLLSWPLSHKKFQHFM